MTALSRWTALVLAAWLPSQAAVAAPRAGEPASRRMAPARDGDVAIRQEFDAARRAGTRAAYGLFIARHPGHPLARAARRERARSATPERR